MAKTAEAFLDEEPTAEDFLDTPSGLPDINEPTGPTLGQSALRSLPGGSIAEMVMPGLPSALEAGIEAAPGALKSTAKSLISPENLIPTAASAASIMAGQPELAPLAAGVSSAGYEIAKGLEPVPPPRTIGEYLYRSSVDSIPGVNIGTKLQIQPEKFAKAIGTGLVQAGFEYVPFGRVGGVGSGALKGKVIPEIAQTARELGVEPSLTQATRESGLAKFLDLMSSGVFATTAKEAKQAKNLEIVSKAAKNLAGDMADEVSVNLSRQQIGESFREGIEKVGIEAQRAVEDALYGRLDDLTGGVRKTVFEAPRSSLVSETYIPYADRVSETQIFKRQFPGSEPVTEVVRNPATGLEEQIVTGYRQAPISREVSEEIEKTVSGKVKASEFEDPIDPLGLKEVQIRTGGLEVSTTDLKRFVQSLSKTAKSSEAVRLAQNILNEGRSLPFREMKELRSDLMRIANKSADPSLSGMAKKLTGAVDESMEKSAREAGDDVYNLWRNANEFTKEGYKVFKSDIISRLIINDNKAAESIGQGIYRRGNVTAVKEFKEAVKRAEALTTGKEYQDLLKEAAQRNPQRYEQLLKQKVDAKQIMDTAKVGFYDELLNGVQKVVPDYPDKSFIDFTKLQVKLRDKNTLETMRELFEPNEMERLNKIVNLGSKVEQTLQGRELPFWRVFNTAGEAMLGTGYAFSRAVQSPQAVKYLTEGLSSVSKGGRVAIQTGTAAALRGLQYLFTPPGEDNGR